MPEITLTLPTRTKLEVPPALIIIDLPPKKGALRAELLAVGASIKAGGIYAICNKHNGKMYLGSTCCFEGRFGNHLHGLRLGKHTNSYLQRAWIKHGEGAFEIRIFVVCPKDALTENESMYIDCLWLTDRRFGYNLDPIVQGRRVCSLETKAKISASNKGRIVTAETRQRISAAAQGRKLSAEHREAYRKAATGRKHSADTIQKFKARRHSEITKAKMSAAAKQRPRKPDGTWR